jgi:hypothetical protein
MCMWSTVHCHTTLYPHCHCGVVACAWPTGVCAADEALACGIDAVCAARVTVKKMHIQWNVYSGLHRMGSE